MTKSTAVGLPRKVHARKFAAAGPDCPQCESNFSQVIDTRLIDGQKRRRRVCRMCDFRFTTFEGARNTTPGFTVKRLKTLTTQVDTLAGQLDAFRATLTELLTEDR